MKTCLTLFCALMIAGSAGLVAGEKVTVGSRAAPSAPTEWQSTPLQPADQGVSTSDLLTTRDINQEIARASQLSASGRDVRVATYRGRVVLRGSVYTTEEKRRLEEIAARYAGAQNVQDEVEVRTRGE